MDDERKNCVIIVKEVGNMNVCPYQYREQPTYYNSITQYFLKFEILNIILYYENKLTLGRLNSKTTPCKIVSDQQKNYYIYLPTVIYHST